MPFDGTAQANNLNVTDSLAIVKDLEALLATPDKWCQHAYGMTQDNAVVANLFYIREAVRYCLMGALHRVTDDTPIEWKWNGNESLPFGVPAAKVMVEEARAWGFNGISGFNDAITTTHTDILAFLHNVRHRLES